MARLMPSWLVRVVSVAVAACTTLAYRANNSVISSDVVILNTVTGAASVACPMVSPWWSRTSVTAMVTPA